MPLNVLELMTGTMILLVSFKWTHLLNVSDKTLHIGPAFQRGRHCWKNRKRVHILLIKKIIQIHIVSQLVGTPKLHVACRAWLIVHAVMHQFFSNQNTIFNHFQVFKSIWLFQNKEGDPYLILSSILKQPALCTIVSYVYMHPLVLNITIYLCAWDWHDSEIVT
jgi:hypothetical protein